MILPRPLRTAFLPSSLALFVIARLARSATSRRTFNASGGPVTSTRTEIREGNARTAKSLRPPEVFNACSLPPCTGTSPQPSKACMRRLPTPTTSDCTNGAREGRALRACLKPALAARGKRQCQLFDVTFQQPLSKRRPDRSRFLSPNFAPRRVGQFSCAVFDVVQLPEPVHHQRAVGRRVAPRVEGPVSAA